MIKHWSVDVEWRPGRWDPMSNAPKDCTEIRGIDKSGNFLEPMHWADGGGDDQPPFRGWFMPYSASRKEGFYQVFPVEWQPLRAAPVGPEA